VEQVKSKRTYRRRKKAKEEIPEENVENQEEKTLEQNIENQEEETLNENILNKKEEKDMEEIKETVVDENVDTTNEENISIDTDKLAKAKEIVKNHVLVSAGFGAVPVPMVDLIGLTGTQLSMLKELSDVYDQDFKTDIAKKSIMSLAGGSLSIPVSAGLSSLIKSVPIIGQTAGVISVATIGAASTYAVGEVFIKHFQSGGTLLTFDATQFKEYFKDKFSKGKEVAEEIKDESSTDSEDKKVS